MPRSETFKPVTIRPLTGLMDTRSTPDEVPVGGYRFVENWTVPQMNRLQRAHGWTRAFPDDSPYNNGDLHDQLEDYTRQHVTMLHEATTPSGFKVLFGGTQNRIYVRVPGTGNWQVISDQYGGAPMTGCPAKRWYADSMRDTVLFTNGDDPVLYHVIGQPLIDAGGQGVAEIPDLARLNITRAKVVRKFGNLMFLMNIEQDGVWHPNRIVCSDFENAVSFVTSDASVAQFQDLDADEAIIDALEAKGLLLLHTSEGIWQLQISGGEETFTVGKRWVSGDNKGGILAYRNTLVSDGESHYYWGKDGIYKYSLFDQEPVRVQWIHRASSRIFEDIDKANCSVHVGGYQGDHAQKQIWWSWAKSGEECPSETILVNTEYSFTSFIDHGISAFVYHEPDRPTSLRDFVLGRCICTPAEWEQYMGGFFKEGGFCYDEVPPTCDAVPASLYSQSSRAVAPGLTIEDWAGAPDPDSLFSLLGGLTLADLCAEEISADECSAQQAFIFASVDDLCLKQASLTNYRERCTAIAGCGTYSQDGYRSKLVSGPLALGIPDDDKIIRRMAIEAHTILETAPAQIALRIGISNHAVDPLTASGQCAIIWDSDLDVKDLACLGEVSAEQHAQDGTRPNNELEWPLYHIGRYIYFELTVKNDSVTPKDTGGYVSLSRLTFDLAAKPRAYGH